MDSEQSRWPSPEMHAVGECCRCSLDAGVRESLEVCSDLLPVSDRTRPTKERDGAVKCIFRSTNPSFVEIGHLDSLVRLRSTQGWVPLLRNQLPGHAQCRLDQIRGPIHCVLSSEKGKRFRCVEYGLGHNALGRSPPSQRIRQREPNSLWALWRHAAQQLDQVSGRCAVALHEGVLHEVEIGRREGRVERDRPLQRVHYAVERQEREVPEMEVRVSQEVPRLDILGISCHPALQHRDRIGAPFIEGGTGSEYECLAGHSYSE